MPKSHSQLRSTVGMSRIQQPDGGARAKTTQSRRVTPETHPFTHDIDFPAVGDSEQHGRFLLVTKGNKRTVLSLRQLKRQPVEELERLEGLNVHSILKAADNEFLKRAHEAARMEPTFKVATQIGWFGDVFITPSAVYPEPDKIKGMPTAVSEIQVHLESKHEDVHSRFRLGGTVEGLKELYRLCGDNSRLMFALALSFVGPICKPFGLRAPGFQITGKAAGGKTVFGVIAGSTYGGIPGSSVGFGSAWNGTTNGLEELAPAYHDTLMILDETSLMPADEKGRVLFFGEALMRVMQGQGKKRFDTRVPERWSTPFISTSNFSVLQLLDDRRRENWEAYVDRLMDIPPPGESDLFFENLHGFKDADEFGSRLFVLATHNYGHPSVHFLKHLTRELSEKRIALGANVADKVDEYKAAASSIASSARNIQRARGYFATVYAAGCLAIRYKILPFTDAELLNAILACHRGHAAFIDKQVRGEDSQATPHPSAKDGDIAIGKATERNQPFSKLYRYLHEHLPRDFIDLRDPMTALSEDHNHATALGYIGLHNGKTEIWLSDSRFNTIVGGEQEGQDLKDDLDNRGFLSRPKRGQNKPRGKVDQRRIGPLGRKWVVALTPFGRLKFRLPKLKTNGRSAL